jgi:ketosteroid isomerase-like protein
MSEENVEIVRQVLDAFQEGLERGDLGAAFDTAMVAADAEWIPGRGFPGPRGYRGREGFIEFMRGWTEDFEGWSNQVERLIDAGNDRVVGVFRQSATGKESGVPVEVRLATIYELEGGQIVRMRIYLDPTEALEAAGLSE